MRGKTLINLSSELGIEVEQGVLSSDGGCVQVMGLCSSGGS